MVKVVGRAALNDPPWPVEFVAVAAFDHVIPTAARIAVAPDNVVVAPNAVRISVNNAAGPVDFVRAASDKAVVASNFV